MWLIAGISALGEHINMHILVIAARFVFGYLALTAAYTQGRYGDLMSNLEFFNWMIWAIFCLVMLFMFSRI